MKDYSMLSVILKRERRFARDCRDRGVEYVAGYARGKQPKLVDANAAVLVLDHLTKLLDCDDERSDG